MAEHEAAAHALAEQLRKEGFEARVAGAGVHWRVDAGPVSSRALRIHCFWYERSISGLMLGVNPANSRSRLRDIRPPYEGPEYLVIVQDGGRRVADGRTRDASEVVACARSWFAAVGLDDLVGVVPFIDKKLRAMRALAACLDSQLRREILGDGYELWVYGEGRSCRIEAVEERTPCGFFVGQVQIALAPNLGDVPAAVAKWLVARSSVAVLAHDVAGVQLERHAEVLESDPARWHWLHLIDRVADARDVLAPLRTLVEALATSPIATTFYSYSSHARLCFSASSHYPWVDQGLPTVSLRRDGTYQVDDTCCDLDEAVARIVTQLEASTTIPFFGCAAQHELPELASRLAQRGSKLQPRVEFHGGWYQLIVADANGARRCSVSQGGVIFIDAGGELYTNWQTFDDVVDAVCRFCEGGVPMDEIAMDRRAQYVDRRTSTESRRERHE